MEFSSYIRKPFAVEAIEVTVENIHEISELIGELKYKDNDVPYIQVNRKRVPNVLTVEVGFWVTMMGGNIRCYSKNVFAKQFVENNEDVQRRVNFINKVRPGETGQDAMESKVAENT